MHQTTNVKNLNSVFYSSWNKNFLRFRTFKTKFQRKLQAIKKIKLLPKKL